LAISEWRDDIENDELGPPYFQQTLEMLRRGRGFTLPWLDPKDFGIGV
jgi:hypothetical protein